ncbi:MAG: DbpA RNA binding domain-containing protein, partial [Pseudomonadales bacterium]|nr:DbpA RNA binding domain-containing protein [Pseudomonadales bacterium]
IGRTGRAGERGMALSIYTDAEQVRLNAIEEYLSEPCICDVVESLDRSPDFTLSGSMATIELNAGRKQKLRPGDLLGALTGDAQIDGACVGRIDIFDMRSFVALDRSVVRAALAYLADGKVKGRSIRARRIR